MRSHIFPLPLARIQIDDPLFRHYAGMIAAKLIPYQWEVLNDRAEHVEKSYCVQNFRIAAGELKAERRGAVFCDTDAYKWLETLAYCLQAGSAKEFEPKADEFIALIGRAQGPDGYLNTYFSVCCPQEKWCNLSEGHEFSAGHPHLFGRPEIFCGRHCHDRHEELRRGQWAFGENGKAPGCRIRSWDSGAG